MTTRRILSAATLSGYPVRSTEGEDLGCVEELMVLPHAGKIAYAVLSMAGFPGSSGRLFAVPWSALELNLDKRVLVLRADREQLLNAPAFHEEHWPDFADPGWEAAVHKHYGLLPVWEAA